MPGTAQSQLGFRFLCVRVGGFSPRLEPEPTFPLKVKTIWSCKFLENDSNLICNEKQTNQPTDNSKCFFTELHAALNSGPPKPRGGGARVRPTGARREPAAQRRSPPCSAPSARLCTRNLPLRYRPFPPSSPRRNYKKLGSSQGFAIS